MPFNITTDQDLEAHYSKYIETINTCPPDDLRPYLAQTINHTGRVLDPDGYLALIPAGIHFTVQNCLVSMAKREASARLAITFDGRTVRELIFYHFDDEWKIDWASNAVEELKAGEWRKFE